MSSLPTTLLHFIVLDQQGSGRGPPVCVSVCAGMPSIVCQLRGVFKVYLKLIYATQLFLERVCAYQAPHFQLLLNTTTAVDMLSTKESLFLSTSFSASTPPLFSIVYFFPFYFISYLIISKFSLFRHLFFLRLAPFSVFPFLVSLLHLSVPAPPPHLPFIALTR